MKKDWDKNILVVKESLQVSIFCDKTANQYTHTCEAVSRVITFHYLKTIPNKKTYMLSGKYKCDSDKRKKFDFYVIHLQEELHHESFLKEIHVSRMSLCLLTAGGIIKYISIHGKCLTCHASKLMNQTFLISFHKTWKYICASCHHLNGQFTFNLDGRQQI